MDAHLLVRSFCRWLVRLRPSLSCIESLLPAFSSSHYPSLPWWHQHLGPLPPLHPLQCQEEQQGDDRYSEVYYQIRAVITLIAFPDYIPETPEDEATSIVHHVCEVLKQIVRSQASFDPVRSIRRPGITEPALKVTSDEEKGQRRGREGGRAGREGKRGGQGGGRMALHRQILCVCYF